MYRFKSLSDKHGPTQNHVILTSDLYLKPTLSNILKCDPVKTHMIHLQKNSSLLSNIKCQNITSVNTKEVYALFFMLGAHKYIAFLRNRCTSWPFHAFCRDKPQFATQPLRTNFLSLPCSRTQPAREP